MQWLCKDPCQVEKNCCVPATCKGDGFVQYSLGGLREPVVKGGHGGSNRSVVNVTTRKSALQNAREDYGDT
jgi:hypothetical protein